MSARHALVGLHRPLGTDPANALSMILLDAGGLWARRPLPRGARWHRVATVDDLAIITACHRVIAAPLDAAADAPVSELACARCAQTVTYLRVTAFGTSWPAQTTLTQ